MIRNDEIRKKPILTKEDMESEADWLESRINERGHDFPDDDVSKTLKVLNLFDNDKKEVN